MLKYRVSDFARVVHFRNIRNDLDGHLGAVQARRIEGDYSLELTCLWIGRWL